MDKIMKFVVTVEDESHETLVTTASARTMPFGEEIEKQGFYDSFDVLEIAVLEMRNERRDAAVSEISCANQVKNDALRRHPTVGDGVSLADNHALLSASCLVILA
jgi:hypothetical protein